MDRDFRNQRSDAGGAAHGHAAAAPGRATLVDAVATADEVHGVPDAAGASPSTASAGGSASAAAPARAAADAPSAGTSISSRGLPRLDLRPSGSGAGQGLRGTTPSATSTPTAPAAATPAQTAPPTPAATPANGSLVTHRTEHVAPDNGTRTRTTVAVGELVNFSSTAAGGWSADRAGSNHAPTASGTTFTWQAPSTPGTATITFTPSHPGQAPERTVMTVIAPTVEYRNGVRVPSPQERPGVAGVMMHSRVIFGPNTVSFRNTMWSEDPGPPRSRRGYFQTWRPRDHEPEPDPIQTDLQNHGPIDEAGYWNLASTQYDQGGSFEWLIPTNYIVFGESQPHLIRTVHQQFTLGPDGTLTVTKDGQHASRTP